MVEAIRSALGVKPVRNVLALVLIVDVVILAIYCVWSWVVHFNITSSYFYDKPFFSSQDWGLMECFGYLKELACTAMLGVIAWKRRSFLFATLTLLLFYIFLDDSVRFHETFGRVLAIDGVPDAFSQFAADGLDGIIPLGLVAIGWFAAKREMRVAGSAVLIPVAILLFFAVGIDTVHQMVSEETKDGQKVFALFEDGGELLTLTLVLTTVTGTLLQQVARLSAHRAGSTKSEASSRMAA